MNVSSSGLESQIIDSPSPASPTTFTSPPLDDVLQSISSAPAYPESTSDPMLGSLPSAQIVEQKSEVLTFNKTKVALLIEDRPLGQLAPLMLHMMNVVPPDWVFRFYGSQ